MKFVQFIVYGLNKLLYFVGGRLIRISNLTKLEASIQEANSVAAAQNAKIEELEAMEIEAKMEKFNRDILHSVVELGGERGKFGCEVNGHRLIVSGAMLRMFPKCLQPTYKIPLRYIIEYNHCKWLCEKIKPGDVAVDVGASGGLISAAMARAVGPTGAVFAFEPANRAYGIFLELIEDNKFTNITLEKIAVSNESGVAIFTEYEYLSNDDNTWRPEASTLEMIDDEFTDTYDVVVTTIDEYFEKFTGTIRAIKIDIEGFEHLALHGANKIIEKHRPYFAIDIHRDPFGNDTTESEVMNILAKFSYDFERMAHVLIATPHSV